MTRSSWELGDGYEEARWIILSTLAYVCNWLSMCIHVNSQVPDVPTAPFHTLPHPDLHLGPNILLPGPALGLPSFLLHFHRGRQQRVCELIVKFSSTSSSLGTNYLSLKSANFPIRVSVCTCDLEIITIW